MVWEVQINWWMDDQEQVGDTLLEAFNLQCSINREYM